MTDREIIQGLIDRDNRITEQFLYVKCRPLFTAIMRLVFSNPVDYDEMVSELYAYLMDNDGAKLRKFEYRSSIYQWMKVVATRFFITKRNQLLDSGSPLPPYEQEEKERRVDPIGAISDKMDLETLLNHINPRYADVIRNLVIADLQPELYAKQIGVTVDNLYNIKKRAMAAFADVAIKYYSYGG